MGKDSGEKGTDITGSGIAKLTHGLGCIHSCPTCTKNVTCECNSSVFSASWVIRAGDLVTLE